MDHKEKQLIRQQMYQILNSSWEATGVDGIDLGIQKLAQIQNLDAMVDIFLEDNKDHWNSKSDEPKKEDDFWFMLVFAVADSEFMFSGYKTDLISKGFSGPWSVREASIRAMAHVNGNCAKKVVETHLGNEKDERVIKTANDLLRDWYKIY